MRYIKKFENYNNYVILYRGCSDEEYEKAIKLGYLPYYSNDPMSTDWEVLEQCYDLSDMDDFEIDEFVKSEVPWEDYTKGVNLSSDESNAAGYGDKVITVKVNCNYVHFGKDYYFAENPKECIVLN